MTYVRLFLILRQSPPGRLGAPRDGPDVNLYVYPFAADLQPQAKRWRRPEREKRPRRRENHLRHSSTRHRCPTSPVIRNAIAPESRWSDVEGFRRGTSPPIGPRAIRSSHCATSTLRAPQNAATNF